MSLDSVHGYAHSCAAPHNSSPPVGGEAFLAEVLARVTARIGEQMQEAVRREVSAGWTERRKVGRQTARDQNSGHVGASRRWAISFGCSPVPWMHLNTFLFIGVQAFCTNGPNLHSPGNKCKKRKLYLDCAGVYGLHMRLTQRLPKTTQNCNKKRLVF